MKRKNNKPQHRQTFPMTLYMPLFRSCTTLRQLTQLHSYLLVTGCLRNDPQASTKLIESYSQMDSLQSSSLVFQSFNNPDSFMWGVLIKCHVWSHLFEQAISLYHRMSYHGTQLSSFVFPSVLRACAGFGDLGVGAKVHGKIIKCGFDTDAVIETSLLGMYGDLGCLSEARKVFDQMSVRDLVSWSSIVSSYVDNGEANKGLEMFKLLASESIELDSVTMLSVAEACGELGFLRLARSVHSFIVTRKIRVCKPLCNSLIEMYSKCGDLSSAERVFVNAVNPSIKLWTSMICCYNQSGWFGEALEVFVQMLESKVEPNAVTMRSVLSSCAGLGWLRQGQSVHCFVLKNDLEFEDDSFGPPLIELYAKCGKLDYSEKVLHTTGKKNLVSWNVLISAYAHQGMLYEALLIFVQMQKDGLIPDSFSLSSSLSVCGEAGLLILGRQIHGYAFKLCHLNEFVQNTLIDMYIKCGFPDSAYGIFADIEDKSLVTWNCMISRFSQSGSSLEAIHLFDQLYMNCLEMTDVAFLSAVQACSDTGQLERGRWLHHKVITYGVGQDLFIDTALADMYAKCGDLRTAERVFDTMSERSVVSWSVMIGAYGIHNRIDSAISSFNQMLELGIKPNDITFMNLLSACAHAGCVDEGKFYFNMMRDFGIEPSLEHFSCMVDLRSRAGDLNEAYRMIKSMPFPADSGSWCTLLNGCRKHQRLDLIRSIERELLGMKIDESGYYALLSNIYAEEGNWDECRKVRSVIDDRGLKKVPGSSTIEVGKRIHSFGAGDASHSLAMDIYSRLEQLNLGLEQGCNAENCSPLADDTRFLSQSKIII